MPGLDVAVFAETPEAIVLTVRGELDLATTKQFKNVVVARLMSQRTVVLDLDGLQFCDSTGLGALAGLHRRAATVGVHLRLAGLHPRVAHVMKLTGISSIIPIFDDVPAALAG